MDAIKEYKMVKHIITPNCLSGGIGEKMSMEKPAIVVKAAPTMAEPVEERISNMLSLLLSDFLNLSVI